MSERDYISLGSIPSKENDSYLLRATNEQRQSECERFKRQMERCLPIPERLPNVEYKVWCTSDVMVGGGYVHDYELVVFFDPLDYDDCEFVFERIEKNIPERWVDVDYDEDLSG